MMHANKINFLDDENLMEAVDLFFFFFFSYRNIQIYGSPELDYEFLLVFPEVLVYIELIYLWQKRACCVNCVKWIADFDILPSCSFPIKCSMLFMVICFLLSDLEY